MINRVWTATLLHQWCVSPEVGHPKGQEAVAVEEEEMDLNQALKKRKKVDLTE